MRMRVFARAVAPCLAIVILCAGCSADAERISSDTIDNTAIIPDEVGVAKTLRAVESLASVAGAIRAECMRLEGFPQIAKAQRLRREVAQAYKAKPLDVIFIDFGPSTIAEANRYGFGGSTFPMTGDAIGTVISRSSEFDRAGERCERKIEASFPDLSRVQAAAAEFRGRVDRYFINGLMTPLKASLLSRFRCVKNSGYPLLDPRDALRTNELTNVVKAAGVAPGNEVSNYEALSETNVMPGAIGVFPPAPARIYAPSKGERRLSRVYVHCARTTGFFGIAKSAVSNSRSATERRYRSEADVISQRLKELSLRISKAMD